MRTFIIVALISVMSAGVAGAQTPAPGGTPTSAQQAATRVQAIRQAIDRLRAEAAIQSALPGMSLTADRIAVEQGVAYAQGNVTITINGAVITADDAFIENGEIRLGANARVKLTAR